MLSLTHVTAFCYTFLLFCLLCAELDVTLDQTMKKIEALRRNPDFIRQFRPILEETLIEKLENMGVKKVKSFFVGSISQINRVCTLLQQRGPPTTAIIIGLVQDCC